MPKNLKKFIDTLQKETLTGRKNEKEILASALLSKESELIAIYGRRRVGKTFLIRTVYSNKLIFEFAGVYEGKLDQQLQNFGYEIQRITKSTIPLATPANWLEAFHFLQQIIEPLIRYEKKVLFFDEFPWIDTRKSGFLAAFENFWNAWGSKQKNLIIVICGSAASWMIRNIVNNKGGLHNRISQRIRLLPFNLSETKDYLISRRVTLNEYQIFQLYMAMGGIPQYLKAVQPGESAAQSIDRICFSKAGMLKTEFKNLYQSLFENADQHISVVKALAAKGKGLTRNEIIQKCKLTSGAGITKLLNELEESGFIHAYIPFGKALNDAIYKLSDEYSLFYLKFIDGNRDMTSGAWQRLSVTNGWRSWSGFAFESICLKHVNQIKNALGISAVQTTESVWRYASTDGSQGSQIDLLIDRADNCINICEMKFSNAEFTIDKSYEKELHKKRNVFTERTKTRKSIFITMVTTYGVKKNEHYLSVVQNDLRMDVLFR